VELNSATTSRPGDTYSPYSAGVSVTKSSPPKAEGDSSPTSKLHRLLAESRQMVQNLEQSSAFSLTGSPKQDSTAPTSDQYTPPQRHLASPLQSRPLHTSAEWEGKSSSLPSAPCYTLTAPSIPCYVLSLWKDLLISILLVDKLHGIFACLEMPSWIRTPS